MKNAYYPTHLLKQLPAVLCALFVLVTTAGKGWAQFLPPTPTPDVVYQLPSTSVQGLAPLTYSYDLTVKSPGTAPTTAMSIPLILTAQEAPAGVALAAAQGYVTISPQVLTFTGAGQAQTVHVTLSIPAGTPVGDFVYQIATSGWPAGMSVIDLGAYINATINPPNGLVPPTVVIESPADQAVFTRITGGPAVNVPVRTVGTATEQAPVYPLTLVIDGEDEDGGVIPAQTIALSYTGLGTLSAVGEANLSISTPGTYHLTATAVNSEGTAVTTSTFIVREEISAPIITIDPPTNNPTYTYVSGLTSATVPYTITARSFGTGIASLTASLDGTPLTLAPIDGLGSAVAMVSGVFIFDATTVNGSGPHTLTATAVDNYGTVTTSETFVIQPQFPAIATTITTPADGSTFPLPPDASPLDIPFAFNTTVTLGGTVETIAATLTSDAVTTSVTLTGTSGLNSPAATGSATLHNVQPGVYTLGATGANAPLHLADYDEVTFTVTPPPPPVIAITQPPQASYTGLVGYPLSIPFAFKTSSTGAYIATQSATLNGQPVMIVSSADGTALVATGSDTLSVPSPAAGTTTYTLVVTGTDVYGQTVSTQTKFDVTATNPVIAIAINPQVAGNSPYTLPASGGVTIPFVFTGTITAGATVDTITGMLGSTAVSITSTTGLGTDATATASGHLVITTPGVYTLSATDTNAASGVTATTSVTFEVKPRYTVPPLSIAITQAPQASYAYTKCDSALSIPFTFVGTSGGGKITALSATFDGRPITLASVSNLNTAVATGKGLLAVSTGGTHVLVVTAKDNYNQTVTTQTSFVVQVRTPAISTSIDTPQDCQTFYINGSGSGGCGVSSFTPISVPFTFTSTMTLNASVDALQAWLDGCTVSVSTSGLGTSTAVGKGTLTFKKPGTYTLSVKGTDTCACLSASDCIKIKVIAAPAPTVTIRQPMAASYTMFADCSSGCGDTSSTGISIPFAFDVTSVSGAITSLSASLNGTAVSVTKTGLNTTTASGSGTLKASKAGKYTLTVSGKSAGGTTTKTFVFYVTAIAPKPTVTINQIADNQVYTYDYGASPPTIPFSLAAQTDAGATIKSIKATLGCDSVTVATAGIGTNAATGSGSVKVSSPGNYTLTVTAVSGCVTVTDKVCFTVKQNPKPCYKVEWTSSSCKGKVQSSSSYVPVSFQVQCSGGSYGSGALLNDKNLKVVIYQVYSNGSFGSTKTYGSSDYSLDSAKQYALKHWAGSGTRRYRVDVCYVPPGETKAQILGSQDISCK